MCEGRGGGDGAYWERGRLARISSTVVPAEAGTHPPHTPVPWAPPLDTPATMELMFPEAQTPPAPTGAVGAAVPSLADIVREKTQGGRLIVRFFLSTMEGEFEDARVHHRVDAREAARHPPE